MSFQFLAQSDGFVVAFPELCLSFTCRKCRSACEPAGVKVTPSLGLSFLVVVGLGKFCTRYATLCIVQGGVFLNVLCQIFYPYIKMSYYYFLIRYFRNVMFFFHGLCLNILY